MVIATTLNHVCLPTLMCLSVFTNSNFMLCSYLTCRERVKVSKGEKTRNRYNQVPHLTQDTNGKVNNSQLDTTNESQEVSTFPAGEHKAHINRRAQRHSKRITALERPVKYFTGGLKPV